MALKSITDLIDIDPDDLDLEALRDLSTQVNAELVKRQRRETLPDELRAAALAYAETGEDPVTFVAQVMATHAADSQNGEA